MISNSRGHDQAGPLSQIAMNRSALSPKAEGYHTMLTARGGTSSSGHKLRARTEVQTGGGHQARPGHPMPQQGPSPSKSQNLHFAEEQDCIRNTWTCEENLANDLFEFPVLHPMLGSHGLRPESAIPLNAWGRISSWLSLTYKKGSPLPGAKGGNPFWRTNSENQGPEVRRQRQEGSGLRSTAWGTACAAHGYTFA